ncbi:MAG: alpha/beta hydrolase [Casimicrobiaceae bacterium]|nr:alpha/beta hydrolase [Casimicrobiaceae bacterium]
MRLEGLYLYTGGRPFNPSRPSALLIHGAANDHSVWALQSRYFAHHGWNVLAPDLPGHGQSASPPEESIEALALRLARVLDALEVPSAFVAGHSMGSLVALELAATRPERIARLALLGTAVPMAVSDTLFDAARQDEPRAQRMIVGWSFAAASQLESRLQMPGFWLPGSLQALMARQPRGVLATDLNACRTYTNGLAAASRIAQPSLLILGERDLMTPPKAASELLSTLRAPELVRLPEVGHAMLFEAPEAVRRALWRFAHAR